MTPIYIIIGILELLNKQSQPVAAAPVPIPVQPDIAAIVAAQIQAMMAGAPSVQPASTPDQSGKRLAIASADANRPLKRYVLSLFLLMYIVL